MGISSLLLSCVVSSLSRDYFETWRYFFFLEYRQMMLHCTVFPGEFRKGCCFASDFLLVATCSRSSQSIKTMRIWSRTKISTMLPSVTRKFVHSPFMFHHSVMFLKFFQRMLDLCLQSMLVVAVVVLVVLRPKKFTDFTEQVATFLQTQKRFPPRIGQMQGNHFDPMGVDIPPVREGWKKSFWRWARNDAVPRARAARHPWQWATCLVPRQKRTFPWHGLFNCQWRTVQRKVSQCSCRIQCKLQAKVAGTRNEKRLFVPVVLAKGDVLIVHAVCQNDSTAATKQIHMSLVEHCHWTARENIPAVLASCVVCAMLLLFPWGRRCAVSFHFFLHHKRRRRRRRRSNSVDCFLCACFNQRIQNFQRGFSIADNDWRTKSRQFEIQNFPKHEKISNCKPTTTQQHCRRPVHNTCGVLLQQQQQQQQQQHTQEEQLYHCFDLVRSVVVVIVLAVQSL